MNTKFSILCDKFIEAGWLAALILTPLYMNIYTHRMFEPDKSTLIRCLALLMMAFYITKLVDNTITRYRSPETPLPQNSPSTWLHFIKTPLFISFTLFVIAYGISVLVSAVPYNSIWGGYDRMQGLYTTAGYWLIFLMVALNLRTKEQIDRIITTVIFTSFLMVIYAFIQRLRLDPVPWQAMDPSERASATMGNPEFLAGYLIIAIPLSISRLISFVSDKRILPSVFYSLVALLQIITVFLTKSRGPIFVIFIGISACILIYALTKHKRNLILVSISAFIIGIIFIVLSGLLNIESFRKLPDDNKIKTLWYGTFGKLINMHYYSGCYPPSKPTEDHELRMRIILWNGVWRLITDKDNPYRFFIGYGPESLSTVYYKNYTMELAKLEGSNIHADRSHNLYLDIWVWHGVIGFAGYLFILGSLIYLGIKSIRLKPAPNQNAPPDNDYLTIITIGLLSTIISYMMESFASVTTTAAFTYFWVSAAVIYAIYRIKSFPQTEELTPETIPVEPQPIEPPNDFITIYSTHDPSEISIIRLKFQDSGIPFVIQNENTQNMLPGVDGFVQAQIQVLQNDIDNAGLLLQGIVKDASQTKIKTALKLNILNMPDIFNTWKLYLLIGYAIMTIAIAFIMFYFSWPAGILTSNIKTVRDALLAIFCLWLLAGIIVGIVAWPRWLFWTYAGQTIILAVIMVKKYWPDDTTDTDLLMIYTWVWFLIGLIIGALSIRDSRKTIKWGNPEGVMAGLITIATTGFIIVTVNLPVLRADGFYKFCFSYDQSAEQAIYSGEDHAREAIIAGKEDEASKIRQDGKNEAYQIRLMCIRHFQNALKFAPNERAYLNGAGRNFLELAKLAMDRRRKDNTTPPSKLHTPPSIKELVEDDFFKRDNNNRPYTDYNYHDFAVCSFSCIQRAYDLDSRNYERIIALIRVYRYLGDMDRDIAKIEKALKLCDEALKASPLNTKTNDEIRELQQRKAAFSAPPPAEQKPK